jgi:hypothetical protein
MQCLACRDAGTDRLVGTLDVHRVWESGAEIDERPRARRARDVTDVCPVLCRQIPRGVHANAVALRDMPLTRGDGHFRGSEWRIVESKEHRCGAVRGGSPAVGDRECRPQHLHRRHWNVGETVDTAMNANDLASPM